MAWTKKRTRELQDDGTQQAEAARNRPKQSIGDLEVPYPYEVWGDGVYRVRTTTGNEKEDEEERAIVPDDETRPASLDYTPTSAHRLRLSRLTNAPLWISRFGQPVDEQEQLLELSFRDAINGGTIQTRWVGRAQISSKYQLVKLAAYGVPVMDVNAEWVMSFLDTIIHRNGGRLSINRIATRRGAHCIEMHDEYGNAVGPRYGWLLGDTWIGPEAIRVASDPRGSDSFVRKLGCAGDGEQWQAFFRHIWTQTPVARWILSATFASPLLRFLRERSFVIHHWSKSGSGKTALSLLAQSAYGDARAQMRTFDRTEKSFTEMFRYTSDLPVLFDELQSGTTQQYAALIYKLCGERGRGRTTPSGGLQPEIEGWHSVIRTTGEEPIVQRDLGGQTGRTIQLSAPGLDSKTAESIYRWLHEGHCGWGGKIFLERLGELVNTVGGDSPPGIDLLLQQNYAIKAELEALITGSSATLITQLAIVATASYLADRWIWGIEPDAAYLAAIKNAKEIADMIASDQAAETVTDAALQLFHDHFVGHRSFWADITDVEQARIVHEGRQRALVGVVAPDEVWIVQREATKLLEGAKMSPRRVWADLRAAGALHVPPSSRGAYATNRKHGKFLSKVYVLRKDATPWSGAAFPSNLPGVIPHTIV